MTIPLLPPPTPTELAVIRARLEPREPFGPKGNRRWHRIVAYLVISLTPIVVMAVAPGRGPAGALAGTSLVAWFFGLQAWSRLRARRIDAAVGVRLEREGAAAGLPQRAADRLGRGAWVMMWLNVAYMTVLVVATLAWLGVRPSFGTLGVSAAVVASAVVQWWCLLDVVRTPAVGTGPVLIQVDAALTRREVWFVNTIALIPG